MQCDALLSFTAFPLCYQPNVKFNEVVVEWSNLLQDLPLMYCLFHVPGWG